MSRFRSSEVPLSLPAALALGVGFVGLWPVALILGFVGLSQTRWGARRGRGLALAGLALATVQGIITVGVLMFYEEPDPHSITKENAHDIADALEKDVDADIFSGR